MCVYDLQAVIGTIRAAERLKAPAIIQASPLLSLFSALR